MKLSSGFCHGNCPGWEVNLKLKLSNIPPSIHPTIPPPIVPLPSSLPSSPQIGDFEPQIDTENQVEKGPKNRSKNEVRKTPKNGLLKGLP